MRGPSKNVGPISPAVLTFIGYKHTDRQAKYIYRYIDKLYLIICITNNNPMEFKNSTSLERKWNHLCVSVDIVENTIIIFNNGKSDFIETRRNRYFVILFFFI